jgi:hypothetical protein
MSWRRLCAGWFLGAPATSGQAPARPWAWSPSRIRISAAGRRARDLATERRRRTGKRRKALAAAGADDRAAALPGLLETPK